MIKKHTKNFRPTVLAFITTAALTVSAAPDQAKLALVASGELKEARASWWGFDAEESTRALQAAIDSRVPRLIVDNTGSPWIADRLRCVSDQEIVFEQGVEVLAKAGAFTGKTDSLFSLVCVTNVTLRGPGATLRMRRADYDAPPYVKAEWRHVLNIRSSANIKVYGLTLAESGGDGIYLGVARRGLTNLDIHIKDVVCDKNYRQGISVISAENLLIEDTVMRDTAGTPPAAGIDFEPNLADERLKNCVMRNCLTENNHGDGYEFYLPNLTRASEPVSILTENCRSVNDRTAVRVITGNSAADAVSGSMTFKGCQFEASRRQAIIVGRKPADGMELAFSQCLVSGCAPGDADISDLLLNNRMGDERAVGNIRLEQVTISQPTARPWILWQDVTFVAEPLTGLSGSVSIISGGTRQELELTPEWAAAKFPPRFTVRVPRVTVDLAKARVVDQAEGTRELAPVTIRKRATYLLFAKAGQEVVVAGRQTQVGK
ncbi:MAG: right-handed parallel beta-helix repeat-containing protein, partial [Kiritimatiellae bacterium]|nr:right-handed parallel beta-helix repeat-containing protein [Kiritimatiellia bacterium]